jgi:uncharacterized protein (TIGR04442 family)
MLKDIRLHGAITNEVDFYANMAGEKLLTAPFYEMREGESGPEISFFVSGQYLKLDGKGITFSGTGGAVSEYMFGSPMPLQDLGHKEVKNRLVFFGAVSGDAGLSFTSNVSGAQTYHSLFLDGNAVSNYFFLLKVPWPYSPRRTQETLLKTLGRVLKRSECPGQGNDSGFTGEILKELAEPDATLLLLRLVHKPHFQFYHFARDYYRRTREWGEAQAQFVARLAEEVGVEEYQRERLAIDILYKDHEHRQIVDEYKDILLAIMTGESGPSAVARLNSLRNLAMRHHLPLPLFDTLDGLIPATVASREAEAAYLRQTREIFEGLFLASRAPSEAIGEMEIVRLLENKQAAQAHRDNGFEEILLETGRLLDERGMQTDMFESLEVFSNVVTYFDRLDNAEAIINQLAFMEEATLNESRVRSILGNKRAFESLQHGLFDRLVVDPFVHNPYTLKAGRQKVEALVKGLQQVESGEKTLAEVAARVEGLAHRERAIRFLYAGIRSHLQRFYFNLGNPVHVRLLEREVTGEVSKRIGEELAFTEGDFAAALELVTRESDYVNNVLPRVLESNDQALREQFVATSGLDLYRLEELEREYQQTHEHTAE